MLLNPPKKVLAYLRRDNDAIKLIKKNRRKKKRKPQQFIQPIQQHKMEENIKLGEEWMKKRKKNFYVFGENSLSFTVFPLSGHVIATGISNFKQGRKALYAFAKIFGIPPFDNVLKTAKVVNSTYDGKITCQAKNRSACAALARYNKNEGQYKNDLNISFRSQFFPGARIKWKNKGTINLFNQR